jgi:hypothetical protein
MAWNPEGWQPDGWQPPTPETDPVADQAARFNARAAMSKFIAKAPLSRFKAERVRGDEAASS